MNVKILLGKCLRQMGDALASPKAFERNKRLRETKRREQELANVSEPVYYVAQIDAEAIGLAALMRGVLSQILYAKQHGWIPVIDMQTKKNPYLELEQLGKENAWEFYFEQPKGVSLQDIKNSKNTIISVDNQTEQSATDDVEFFTNPDKVKFWRNFYKENIVFNSDTQKYMDEQYDKLIGQNGYKVLGVICRGTDYIEGRPYRHPVQPLPEDVIAEASMQLDTGKYDKIFLATEDSKILKMFQKKFGDKLLFIDQQRYDDGKTQLALQSNYAKNTNPRTEGLKYLSAIYIMSKCDALVGGRCGMTVIAYIASEGYSYEKFWNIGRYGIDEYCMPKKYL